MALAQWKMDIQNFKGYLLEMKLTSEGIYTYLQVSIMILFSVFLHLECNTEYFSELSAHFNFTKWNQLSWKQTIATKKKQYFWTLEMNVCDSQNYSSLSNLPNSEWHCENTFSLLK